MAATSTASLLSRMADLEHQDVEKTLRTLLYGPPGGGKTTLAAGLAQRISGGQRILFIDSADGWVSLENIPSLKKNMTRLQYQEYGDLVAAADAMKKGVKGFSGFNVTIVDEISSICDDTLELVVRKRCGTEAGAPTPESEWTDYKTMGDLVVGGIKKLMAIPGMHVILVAHARTDKDNRGVTKTASSISPKLRATINGLMHIVANVTAEIKGNVAEPKYVRQVQPMLSGLVEAKTRLGNLQVKMEFNDFVQAVAQWIESDQMANDLAEPEGDVELQPDEIPTDGLPVSEDADDEPVFVSEDS